MKKLYLFVFFILLKINVFSQDFNWAYTINNINATDILVQHSENSNSNFSIIGYSMGKIDMKNQDKNSNGYFIGSYNADASLRWSYSLDIEAPLAVLHFDNDEVLVAALFTGNKDLDPSSGTNNQTSDGYSDLFLIRFNPDGSTKWIETFKVESSAFAIDLQLKEISQNRLMMCFGINADASLIGDNNSTHDLKRGIAVLQLNNDGKIIKSGSIKFPQANNFLSAFDFNEDKDGNLIICGSFNGEVNFDLKQGSEIQSAGRGVDGFVVKYDSDFNYLWHKTITDFNSIVPSTDLARSVITDANGNILMYGQFTWTSDFDRKNNPGVHILQSDDNTQNPSAFLVKYDATGEIIKLSKIGGDKDKIVNLAAIKMIKSGDDLLLAMSSIHFGTGELNLSTDPNNPQIITNTNCRIIARYNSNFEYQNHYLFEKINISSLSSQSTNQILFSGTYNHNADIDPGVGNYILKVDTTGPFWQNDLDLFVSRLGEGNSSLNQSKIEKSEMKLYPNPSNYRFYLVESFDEIKILDIKGQVLFKGKYEEIDFNTIPCGMFIVEGARGNQITRNKWIKFNN